jgi:DNA-binding Xre family transcriptional regulator
MERTEWTFDTAAFMNDVRRLTDKRGKPSLRDIQNETNISAATFSRLNNGFDPDLTTVLKVCTALDLSPCDYFKFIQWEGKVVK